MLCQDCKKREAHVHLTQIVNNEKQTLSLCKECAAARGFHSPLDNVPFPLAEILSGLAASMPAVAGAKEQETITCESCGLTFETFTRQGRFGCGDCYKAFRTRLEPIMRKIHGASLHRGRVPEVKEGAGAEGEPISIREEERLEIELKKAIESEDFERAAELRDKLKTFRESRAATD
ncbi:MAG: UvrB/UvrC motif-containing protein [Candidatus Zixiibacteriota bacterium]|nr:MAG: UvrB/UvrC motif-containing protein [candidate division Zixibacteria bacterium]